MVARVGVASSHWLELADVLICPSRRTIAETRQHAHESLRTLPGSMIAAAGWGGCTIVLVRDGDEMSFCGPAQNQARSVEDHALWCYSWVASSPGFDTCPTLSASNRACTCRS